MNAASAVRAEGGGPVYQELGSVVGVGGALRVQTGSGIYAARVAASCLLEPEAGDRVLVAVPPHGDLFVLAVLERGSDGPARVRLGEQDAVLAVPGGKLSVVSRDGMQLATTGRLELAAAQLGVRAEEGELFVRRLVTRSREVLAHATTLEGVFEAVDTAAERLTQRLGRSYRFVEETDVTRAKDIDTRAGESFVMRAKDALMRARRLVKLDGEQIHLG